MRNILATIFTFLFLSGIVFSQVKKSETGNEIKLEENTTAVFVKAECEGKENVRFRLFNHTDWAVAVSTFSFYLTPDNIRRATLQDGREIYLMPNNKEISSLFYYTEREKLQGRKKSLVLGGYRTDSYNTSWIGAKDSIIFSIPKDELKDTMRAYLLFKYEWELKEKAVSFPGEVQHRVYFRFPDDNNPQKLAVCSKS
ncbi:MAG: hypothetical protein M3384_02955 [Acidobacteriota bacterium]|nr:hypothetical protein [Acidobacteriota bacterium]